MHLPQVPCAKRGPSVRGEKVGLARADDARIQCAVVRAVMLYLRSVLAIKQLPCMQSQRRVLHERI